VRRATASATRDALTVAARAAAVLLVTWAAATLALPGDRAWGDRGAPRPAPAALTVDVGPVHPVGLRGVLRAYVCDNPGCYRARGADPQRYRREAVSAISASTIRFEFHDLPPGEYSVFVHHDRDGDGSVTSATCGVFGKPVDGIGWSRNVDPRRNWGEPGWEQVRISLASGETTVLEIRPIYMCD
jgi:uncharacterized protein (DUF2141 family)